MVTCRRLEIGRVVEAVDLIAREFLEKPVLEHGARAAQALLGGLEDQDRLPIEISRLREVARGAEEDRGVAVMAAAMEAVGNGRAPRKIGVLLHRQGIHIGAKADAAAIALSAIHHADDAGPADAAMHLDAPTLQLLGDEIGGTLLLEADFRMRMNIAPNGGQLVGEAVDEIDSGHGGFPGEGASRSKVGT